MDRKDDMFLAPSVIQNGEDIVYETMKEKRELSCRVLLKGIHLVDQIPQAIELYQESDNMPKIRDYLVKCQDVLAKYCKKYGLCDRSFNFPPDLDVKHQIVLLSVESMQLMRAMKRSLSIQVSMSNPVAQDLIFRILRKINARFEQYLVNIHYWHDDLVAAGYEVY